MASKTGEYRLVKKVAKNKKADIRETLSIIFTGLAALAALGGPVSLILLSQQMQAAASQEIHNQLQELNRTFVDEDNHKLRPFFHGGEEITTTHELYPEAVSMADLHLDFFDIYWSQVHYAAFDETEERTWRTYMKDMFEQSPIVCRRLDEVKCWYTPDYLQFAFDSCPQGTLTIQDYEEKCS